MSEYLKSLLVLPDFIFSIITEKSKFVIDRIYTPRFQKVPKLSFFEQLQAQTYATFQKYLKPVPGIGAVLGKISLPKCVASSGTIDKIEFTLTLTGLRHHFGSAVFSASQVPRGKPYPDLFLHAAQQFSVSPNACIVVEDSIPGVLGARAAGMHVLGYAGGTHVRPNHDHLLTEAGAQVFLSMTSLPKLLTTKFE